MLFFVFDLGFYILFSGKTASEKKPAKSRFILHEADVSGADTSDEEESIGNDQYDASFVDNTSQKVSDEQERMYLESLRYYVFCFRLCKCMV